MLAVYWLVDRYHSCSYWEVTSVVMGQASVEHEYTNCSILSLALKCLIIVANDIFLH